MGHQVYMSDKEVAERFSIGRATVWRWVKEQGFPSPIRLSENCTRWRLEDVVAWEAKRSRESTEQEEEVVRISRTAGAAKSENESGQSGEEAENTENSQPREGT